MHKTLANTQPSAGCGTAITEAASGSLILPHFETVSLTAENIFTSGLWSGDWTGARSKMVTGDWFGTWTGDWTGEVAAEELTSSFALRAVTTAASTA